MEGRINLNVVLAILACIAVGFGVAAYFIIFGAGTQAIQPQNISAPTASSGPSVFIFPSSTASSPLSAAGGTPSPATSTITSGIFSSILSAPYPVTWSEGQSAFAISGATLAGDELTLLVNVSVGAIPQCVPVNMRLISDEQGDMVAPISPAQTNFPLSTSTCQGTSNTLYPSQPLTFTVDPANTPFLFLTGGSSNIYFEVATTTNGGLDVSIPQQSG